jgi:3-hydroxyacyl-CoA dehydrogenase
MDLTIERAAVVGAGVMGAALAAHLANAGVPTLLLDIVPPDGSGVKGDPSSTAYRNAFASTGLERARKSKPASFYTDAGSRLVRIGNLEDDLDELREVDWVLEAVVEKLDIKKALFEKIAPFLKDTAVLTTNTSGLSVNDMADAMPEPLRPRFLGTHFFNPPRYLRLLEIVPHAHTDAGVLDAVSRFGEEELGKGVVVARDTPDFIANRIGCYWLMSVIRAMLEGGYTVEEADALTGPVVGRPKSASFRTADVVGIDVFVHASYTVYERATDDEERDIFKPPDVVERMVKEGRLGEKSGQGFYKKVKKDGKSEILTLDIDTFDYRERQRPKFASLDRAKTVEDVAGRTRQIVRGKDRASQFLWRVISETLVYSANRLEEIADDVVSVDRAMKWGYGWELGPFEMWDAVGVEYVVERLQEEGREVPKIARAVLDTPEKAFYSQDDAHQQHYFAVSGTHEKVDISPTYIDLERIKATGGLVKKNASASLVDIGDDILCLEFHSKMNAIGPDIISMIQTAVRETEKNYAGLVIGNQGKNFSVGANLMLLLLEAQEMNWEEIDLMVRAFQNASMAIKYCKRPVVAAPFGMTLAGGCEICLGAGHMYAAAETYIGLVEFGVGLIPAGGGCKEVLLRNLEGMPAIAGTDPFPVTRAAFETIGLAKVATSAAEAKDLKIMRRSDGITMNPDRLLHGAKEMTRGLAAQGYRRPDPTIEVPVAGESGMAAVRTQLYNMREAGWISEYDEYIGNELARVLCGGAVPSGTKVNERYILDLEREVFLRLCGQRKTLERMQYMLKKGKPLRN